MRHKALPLTTIALVTTLACVRSDVVPRQPNLPAGGRAIAIAVKPDDAKRLVVASETGGLFRSFDAGASWHHVPGFPSHFAHDVTFAALGPQILIATTRSRFRAVNDGGIWRSTDGGASWTQPVGALPPPSRNCPARPSAYAISFLPLTRTVYVATDCGLAKSTDNGVTWTIELLNPAAPFVGDSLQHRVWSVSVLTRTSGVAAADGNRGLFFLDRNGTWQRAASGPLGGFPRAFHAFGVSPWSADHWFHVGRDAQAAPGGRALWMSVDRGANWTVLDSPAQGGRESFIRVARAVSGDDRTFNLYLGTGVNLFRRVLTHAASGPVPAPFTQLQVDHADPADIAFDIDRRDPILLATDGGLHGTTDKGATWKFTGGGPAGYNALQVTEVIGQEVDGRAPHMDLYFGTQDNDIKASPDGGSTWPGSRCCEGFFLRISPQATDHKQSIFTGAACGACGTFKSREHLDGQAAWPNPDDGDATPANKEFEGTPFLIVNDAYLQSTIDSATPARVDYWLTLSAGAAWTRAYALGLKPRGPPRFAGSLANPTAYQGHRFDTNLPNGGFQYALTRIRSIATTPQITRADNGLGGMGVLKTMFAFYTVFGSDPNDASRLIAPDLVDNQMKFSRDGGQTWTPDAALTAAVTDNGKFIFRSTDEPLASVIAFDPYDSCHIIIGTHQRGLIRTTDGGGTWTFIRGSQHVTYPTSVYFPRTGRPWVSSYGRGLWQLKVSRRATNGNCAFFPPDRPVRFDSTLVLDAATGASRPFRSLGDACPTCEFLTVRGGWFTGTATTGDTLTSVAISSGILVPVDTAGRERPARFANTYSLGEWRSPVAAVARAMPRTLRLRAIGVEAGRIRVLVVGARELALPERVVPSLQVVGVSTNGTVARGSTVRVVGSAFAGVPPGGMAQLLVDGVLVADRIQVSRAGTFTTTLTINGALGADVELVVMQQDGVRLLRASTTIRVVAPEE